MIELQNIDLAFKDRQLFQGFSLKVKRGQKAAIYGKSGAGKSTLLNIIMGFKKPDKGKVIIDGTELNAGNIESTRSKIAWLPQNFHSFGSGTVLDFFKWIFLFKNNTAGFDESVFFEYSRQLGLNGELIKARFASLSGGEKQRFGIILCKMLKKEILLLDEPSSALDKQSIMAVNDFIFKEKELTVLVSTHEDEIMKQCDQLYEI